MKLRIRKHGNGLWAVEWADLPLARALAFDLWVDAVRFAVGYAYSEWWDDAGDRMIRLR